MLEAFLQEIPREWCFTKPEDIAPYTQEWRGNFFGKTPLVLKPQTAEDIVHIVKCANKYNIPFVPQGGNTGLCGGGTPDETGEEIIISLTKLNHIISLDSLNHTLIVESGCIIKTIQDYADNHNLFFPLSLGSEGSCQIGGTISTNAGGLHVLQYGMMRNLVLGLEVVLPDGTLWQGLRALKKDNTGYDLKQLFIGAEGTLGIITKAVLQLYPQPQQRVTLLIGFDHLDEVIIATNHIKQDYSHFVTSLEVMCARSTDWAIKHQHLKPPFPQSFNQYLLVELTASLPPHLFPLNSLLESFPYPNTLLAQNEAQRQQFWQLREAVVLAQKQVGASIKNDITLPLSHLTTFLNKTNTLLEAACPGIRPIAFGHIGDGNIHYDLLQPETSDPQTFLGRWQELTHLVNQQVEKHQGSFSAEHGIGRLKKHELATLRSTTELNLMRQLKQTLDPKNLCNRGRIFDLDK